jgi:hypothetical protein
MRTTVTLDPDVEHYIRDACHQRKASFKRVLNETLRQALKPTQNRRPKLLPPRSMGLTPGVDPRRLSELADDLEAEAFLAAEETRRYGSPKGKQ